MDDTKDVVVECKTIQMPSMKRNKKKEKKERIPPKKRIITHQRQWVNHITPDDIQFTGGQLIFLGPEKEEETGEEETGEEEKQEQEKQINKKKTIMMRELRRKIEGYRHQDILKHIFDEAKFVDMDHVLQLLRRCDEKCFYCKESVQILYDVARDPKQWTLERIYNDRGHNKDNVEIACLSCNIKRRTMFYEKYRFTKQVKFVKEL